MKPISVINRRLSIALLSVLLGSSPGLQAHDTDIYVNNPSTSLGTTAKIMISIDLRSSVMNANGCSGSNCDNIASYMKDSSGTLISTSSAKKLDVYRAALAKVLQEEIVDKNYNVQIGLMVPHDDNCTGSSRSGPSQTGCSNGGYIMSGYVNVKDPTYTTEVNRSYLTKLRSIPNTGNHPYQGSELFFEFYRYLKGTGIYNGHVGYKDYGNNTASGNLDTDWPSLTWDSGIESGANYVSPLANVTSCTKVYSLNFMFGVLNSDSDSDTQMASDFGVTIPNSNNSRFETVLRYLYDADLDGDSSNGKQNVTSYFLVPSPSTTENGFASAGSGGAVTTATDLNTTPDQLVENLQAIFRSILSTSTTFVAPSVAVNVYNRSQVLSDFFVAMFQVDENNYPTWPGNVKKYALQNDSSGALAIQDVNNTNAVDAVDGRIVKSALSYWTIRDDLPAPAVAGTFDAGKDGRIVNRGGSGSRVPGFKLLCDNTDYTTDTSCYPGSYSPGLTNASGNTTNITARRLFTEPDTFTNGTVATLMALNADQTTANTSSISTNLGATTAGTFTGTNCTTDGSDTTSTSACNLLKYVRGLNADGTNRPWMMGDILHSRPLAINYGTTGGYSTANPNVRVFVGSNDGQLHSIRNTTTGAVQDGAEAWAFMPRQTMSIVSTLKANTAGTTHPYGVDAAPAAYVYDVNQDGNIDSSAGDKVIVYFGLGRGGNAYYALDVTDPETPKLLWRIQRTSGGDFDEMGQTWSTPRVTDMVYGGSSTPAPVLIFAGGYDTNKDTSSLGHTASAGGNDTYGNAVYVVNALTGALVWKAVYNSSASTPNYDSTTKAYRRNDMRDSIPSTVTVMDANGNGLADRIYVGDTGGKLWRGDLYSNNESAWSFVPILSVGRHYDSSASTDRRFFFPPDVTQTKEDDGTLYDAVSVGTGDRESPLATTVTNYFYMFKDFDTTSGNLASYTANGTRTPANLDDVTSNCLQDNTCSPTPTLANGWRMKLGCPNLGNPSTCGEKSLATAVTIKDVIYFTTYVPPSSTGTTCGPVEGSGLLYIISQKNATAVFNLDTSTTGLTTSDRFDEIASAGIPTEVVPVGGNKIVDPGLTIRSTPAQSGFRTFWYMNE